METALLSEAIDIHRVEATHAVEGLRPKISRPISPAERKILGLAVRGYTDKEICRELGLSITTVRTHWTRLRRKLGVVNRAQAIAESLELESGEQLRVLNARLKAMHRVLNLRGIGLWEWDIEHDRITADDLSYRIFNISGAEEVSIQDFLSSLPIDDRANLVAYIRDSRSNGPSDGVTHRVRLGNSRVLLARTRVTRVNGDDRLIICTTETISQA